MLTTRVPSLRTAVVTASALSALLLTSACGGDDVTVKTPDGTVKVDSDSGSFSAEGGNGDKVEGGTSLPDDFPDIPLVEGRIIQGTKVNSGDDVGFTASIEVKGNVDDVSKDAVSRLEDAGLTADGYQSSTGAMSMATFRNAEWQVLMSVSESGDDGNVFVNYTVAPATP